MIKKKSIELNFCCFSDIIGSKYNLYKYFFSCLDTATDDSNKGLHRSTQRAWFISTEWGIKLPGVTKPKQKKLLVYQCVYQSVF